MDVKINKKVDAYLREYKINIAKKINTLKSQTTTLPSNPHVLT